MIFDESRNLTASNITPSRIPPWPSNTPKIAGSSAFSGTVKCESSILTLHPYYKSKIPCIDPLTELNLLPDASSISLVVTGSDKKFPI